MGFLSGGRGAAAWAVDLGIHGRVEVVGRIQVGAVVRRQLHHLHRPAFTIGQVLLLESGKEGLDLRKGVLVGEVLDLGREGGRIAQHIVLEKDGKVDKSAGHRGSFRGKWRKGRSMGALPSQQAAFDEGEQGVAQKTDSAQQDDAGEELARAEAAGGQQDGLPQTGLRGNHLAHHRHDE